MIKLSCGLCRRTVWWKYIRLHDVSSQRI